MNTCINTNTPNCETIRPQKTVFSFPRLESLLGAPTLGVANGGGDAGINGGGGVGSNGRVREARESMTHRKFSMKRMALKSTFGFTTVNHYYTEEERQVGNNVFYYTSCKRLVLLAFLHLLWKKKFIYPHSATIICYFPNCPTVCPIKFRIV